MPFYVYITNASIMQVNNLDIDIRLISKKRRILRINNFLLNNDTSDLYNTADVFSKLFVQAEVADFYIYRVDHLMFLLHLTQSETRKRERNVIIVQNAHNYTLKFHSTIHRTKGNV